MRVERHLYRPAGRNTKSICPLELRAGILQGYWTPRAARQGAFVIAQLPASAAEALFEELRAMQPSRSTLDRLLRTLSAHLEAHRPEWEGAIQAQETVPTEATTLAISVDGVMAPLKPHAAERVAKRAAAGKHASGPTGYREVGCGTLTLVSFDLLVFPPTVLPPHRPAVWVYRSSGPPRRERLVQTPR